MHPVYDKVMGVGNVTFFSVFPFFFLICHQRKHSSRISDKFVSNCLKREQHFKNNNNNKKNSEQKNMLKVRKKYLKSSNEH